MVSARIVLDRTLVVVKKHVMVSNNHKDDLCVCLPLHAPTRSVPSRRVPHPSVIAHVDEHGVCRGGTVCYVNSPSLVWLCYETTLGSFKVATYWLIIVVLIFLLI